MLGLDLLKKVGFPAEVLKLVKQRERARLAKDWKMADALRKEIIELGFDVQDKVKGPFVTEKSKIKN